ncbi:KGG domain-containing protein [Fictibacillus enclensis]|uniref:Stress-induced protein, KGG, repeat-containing protein n=1 Tax=Fictibacillus enclensis TaxID=1017270 RepID=A0A0V8J8G0_9BACL|nr:stress-induced protein, KGG, repeat-containing protein [Fictibacillus enclensis]RXZ02035.1 stress-induced protein, KGG, repeat-containing protein [Fictibacillus sp. S7]SCC13042.1 Stress-induced acidophilic repeat motif-containing protein [Fictibacillus enclensis]
MAKNNDHNMSREEAGKKGGEATSRSHDKEFYQEIGQKGGQATSKAHNRDFYEDIGKKGGRTSRNTQ